MQVVVVGAGAFGGWTALQLVRRGARVVLIDAFGAGNSRSSSGGETRIVRRLYRQRLYAELTARSLDEWRACNARWRWPVYERTGALFMAQSAGRVWLDAVEATARAVGYELATLATDDVARRWPQIALHDIERALFEPDAGVLHARRACRAVVEEFVALGGTYEEVDARPSSAGRDEGVQLSDGRVLAADAHVFACGPWLPHLFPEVLARRLVVSRQEVFFFGLPPDDRGRHARDLPVWADVGERFVYGIPGNEARGFKLADDTRGDPHDPTTADRRVSEAGVAFAKAYLARRFPALAGAPLVESRVCQYTNSATEDYLVDRHPHRARTYLVGGGSGHGFKCGPAVGELVASLVLDGRPGPDEMRVGGVGR
jgi:glycine/D-amino acid oxidase-like deaminating enzyme